MNSKDYDIAVIGAGVSGCSIARELSRYALRIALVEAGADVAAGSSKANSAIVHAGFDCVPGTLMAKLNVEGTRKMEGLCSELGVPFRKNGSFVLAFNDDEKDRLKKLKEQGEANGVQGLEIWTAEQVRKAEPEVNQAVIAALWAPTAGIVCPYELTLALAENAVVNGVIFFREWKVSNIQKNENGFCLKNSTGEQLCARWVINAAGLYADEISAMVATPGFVIKPRRGEYVLYDRKFGHLSQRTLFQLPSVMGKGVLVSPTVDGNLFVGPNAEDIASKTDTAVTAEGRSKVIGAGLRSLPGLKSALPITAFSGLRAVLPDRHDFLLDWAMPGFFNVAGICSPGLSAAPAMGSFVAEALRKAGLGLQPNLSFTPKRAAPVHFRMLGDTERAQLIKQDSSYGRIVCRCESVTEAEIVHAVTGPLPATTLDGVKLRTRVGMGRCQGGFCTPRVMEILSREQGRDMECITKSGGDSWLVCRKLKAQEGDCDE